MRRHRALLVGNWHYPDDPANLPDLKGPLNDVSRLAEALADATAGLFAPADVTTLTERASYEIVAELESFFGEATRDDVLLFYYSGHGITADNGSLLLCGRNARTDRKLASTVSSETVDQMIRGCPAAAVVIVLDCCHAGAFKSGDLAGELAGKGRFVLTASRAKDRAPDAEHSTGMSRFTAHLLRGLRGAAALPDAAHITLSDLYRYVCRKMREDGPIIPQRRFDGDGEITIARHIAIAAPEPDAAPPPAAAAPSLLISETLIDLAEVREGEAQPVERVQVTGRAADGSPAPWSAETEADWLTLLPRPGHLDIRVTPRAGATRANIHVRNDSTGEIRTIRVSARPVAAPRQRPAQPPPAQPSQPSPVRPAPATAAHLAPRWQRVLSRGPAVVGGPKKISSAFERAMVTQALLAHPVAGLAVPPGGQTRAEKAARRVAGVAEKEITLGALDLPGDGFVLFTDRAVYWTNQGQVAAVPYSQFVARRFAMGTHQTHIDLGDGVPRLVDDRAAALLGLLENIRERLIAGADASG